MSWRRLAAIGLAAFVVFALVTLPARIVLARLAPASIRADGVSGTIWNGRAQAVAIEGARIGSAEWRLHPWALLTARVSADVRITRVDGFLQTQAAVTPGGRARFHDLTGSLPISALPPSAAPGGWTGTLNLRLARLVLRDGWPIEAEGTVEIVDLAGPAARPIDMGNYRVTFTEQATSDDEVLRGALADGGGPLQLSGELQLNAQDRSYLIEGLIAARPDAPRELLNTVQFLGEADPEGRRPFSLSGTM
jgi:general secretion pathway protein N